MEQTFGMRHLRGDAPFVEEHLPETLGRAVFGERRLDRDEPRLKSRRALACGPDASHAARSDRSEKLVLSEFVTRFECCAATHPITERSR